MVYISRNSPTGLLGIGGESAATHYGSMEGYEGVVVDVVVDQFHSNYGKDGYPVGSVKVRIFEVDGGKNSEFLDWASPIDSTIQEYPLLGEKVKILKALGKAYYLRKTNLTNTLQDNAMLNLEAQLDNRAVTLRQKVTSENKELEKNKHKFGEYYKPDSRVRQLKHFEGDVLIQGKMGNSIRFGSSQMDISSKSLAPNIIIRAGQAKDAELNKCSSNTIHGLILEDVNNDVSSLWLTTDQIVNFKPITRLLKSHYRSILNATTVFDGASAIMNSDRVIISSKKNQIMLFSNDEIYMNSYSRIGMDTNESIALTANIDISARASGNFEVNVDEDILMTAASDASIISSEKISMLSNKIFVGSINSDAEPLVGGTSLSKWLARLILVLMGTPVQVLPWTNQRAVLLPQEPISGTSTVQHTIPMTGILSPPIVTGLMALYKELAALNSGQQVPMFFAGAPFNSQDNYTTINNQNPSMAILKNEFKEGTKLTIENNKWNLSDPYYKVI